MAFQQPEIKQRGETTAFFSLSLSLSFFLFLFVNAATENERETKEIPFSSTFLVPLESARPFSYRHFARYSCIILVSPVSVMSPYPFSRSVRLVVFSRVTSRIVRQRREKERALRPEHFSFFRVDMKCRN